MPEAVGPMSLLPASRREPPAVLVHNGISRATREILETEGCRVLAECSEQRCNLLTTGRSRLEQLVEAPLQEETLHAGHIYRAAGLPTSGKQEGSGHAFGNDASPDHT